MTGRSPSIRPPSSGITRGRPSRATCASNGVYRGGGELRDIAHQLGVPIAAAAILVAPAAWLVPALAVIALAGAAFLLALGAWDFSRVRVPRHARKAALKFRLDLTLLNLLQPVARAWGRARNRALARRNGIAARRIGGPVQNLGRGVFVMPESQPRPQLAENLVQLVRRAGMRVVPPTGWEPYDALVLASVLVGAELVTTAHPPGWLQLRVRRYLRVKPALLTTAVLGVAALADVRLAVAFGIACVANIALGMWRTGPGLRRVLMRGGAPAESDR